MDHQTFWKRYFRARVGRMPAKILRHILEKYSFPKGSKALDIGAGDFVESAYLLEHGFDVTALDPSDASEELAATIQNSSFHYIKNDLSHLPILEKEFDLIISFMTLSHIPKDQFMESIKKIHPLLNDDGMFIGNFFGIRDGWNIESSLKTFLKMEDAGALFKDFEILYLGERERDDTYGFAQITNTNDIKHWHIITLVARKKTRH